MKNNIITLIIFILILQLGSCKSLKNDKELKNAILDSDLTHFQMLFFPTDENQVGYITIFDLRKIFLYSKKYDNCNIDSLLSEALKGRHSFSCKELEACFDLSNVIVDNYRELPFSSFLEKFTRYCSTDDYFIINNELAENEKETVAYFLYLNGYYTSYDDYDGLYISTKGMPVVEIEEFDRVEDDFIK